MANVSFEQELPYRGPLAPIWCPGCGDFAAARAAYRALAQLGLQPHEVAVCTGIGCSGRFADFINAYGFHGVHGRVLPLAQGVKLANPPLTVLAVGGDGDGFSIGGGHVPHAARRNIDFTYLVLDNSIYGQTKGQTSPTSPEGTKTKSSPFGSAAEPLNPIALALAYDASFVARTYSARLDHVQAIIEAAIRHKGFSLVQILSPCTTFYDTYHRLNQLVVDLPPDHDATNRIGALTLAMTEDRLHQGIFYQQERPTYSEITTASVGGTRSFDVNEFLDRFH